MIVREWGGMKKKSILVVVRKVTIIGPGIRQENKEEEPDDYEV